jgi:GGDEF domain-containing protein
MTASASSLTAARAALAPVETRVEAVYRIATSPAGLAGNHRVPGLQKQLAVDSDRLFAVLTQIGQTDSTRARRARWEAGLGRTGAVLALVGAFLIFYVRAMRARSENADLLEISQVEASTDALTGLGNRRALIQDLAAAVATPEAERLLAMFDLNGFKTYNDTFGHGAGDALLARLGGRLSYAVDRSGSAYRMGGDEFCVLVRCPPDGAVRLIADAEAALSDQGEGWILDCSSGAVWIPSEAASASRALLSAATRWSASGSRSPLPRCRTPRGWSARAMSGSTGPATPTDSPASRFRSGRASSRSATRTRR